MFQRYEVLEGLLKSLDCFAVRSLSPDTYENLQEILNELKERYKEGQTKRENE